MKVINSNLVKNEANSYLNRYRSRTYSRNGP
jgi:hypothetical protein